MSTANVIPPAYEANGDAIDSHAPLPTSQADSISSSQLPYSSSVHFKSESNFNSSFGIKVYSSTKGTHYSSSKALNNNSHALSSFLLYYNRYSPIVQAICRGTHEESRSRTVTDSNGNTSTEYYTVKITDFYYSIDLTRFLQPGKESPNIYAKEEKVTENDVLNPLNPFVCAEETAMEYDELLKCKLSEASSELVNSYIRDGNPLKQVVLEKKIQIDYRTLRRLIHDRIRELGYRHEIQISFTMKRNHIKVRNGTVFSFFGNTKEGRLFCALSCMWVFFLPAYVIAKHCCYKEKDHVKMAREDSATDVKLCDEVVEGKVYLNECDFKNKKEYKKAVKKMSKQQKKEAKEVEKHQKVANEQIQNDKRERERKEMILNGTGRKDSCVKYFKSIWSALTPEQIYLQIVPQIHR